MPIFSLISLPPTLSVWPSISMKAPFGSALSLLIISSILAFVLADDHREDDPLRRLVERIGSRADFGRPGAGGPGVVAGRVGGLLRCIGRALRRLCLRVHVVDRAFVLPRPFLGFLDGLRQVVNFAVDLPHAVSDELLGGACCQTYGNHAGKRQCRHPFRHTVPPQELL